MPKRYQQKKQAGITVGEAKVHFDSGHQGREDDSGCKVNKKIDAKKSKTGSCERNSPKFLSALIPHAEFGDIVIKFEASNLGENKK